MLGLRVKVVVLALVAAAMSALLLLHVRYVNGPGFWAWRWRTIPATPVYLLFPLAAVPFFAGLAIDHKLSTKRWSRSLAIVLLMLSCFLLKLASIHRQDLPDLSLISMIVQNPDATSYYTDASAMSNFPLRTWISLYPQMMKELNLHSKTKPPGPILYWLAWIKLMGVSDRTAMAGGIVLGVIATFAIPATYLLLSQLLGHADAAFCGASFLALCPGFVLFFPMMDPTYILLSAAMIGSWYRAIKHNSPAASILLGTVLGISCLITFNLLVLGAFMAGMALCMRVRVMRLLAHAGLATAACCAVLTILWLTMNYDALETFRSAWRNQHALLASFPGHRPYPATIPFDLLDLALGTGWISFILVIFWLIDARHQSDDRSRWPLTLTLLALGQFVLVAALGLLQMETARVWNFMFPLLMIPIGLELRTWPAWARVLPYASLVVIAAVMCQNLKLIY